MRCARCGLCLAGLSSGAKLQVISKVGRVLPIVVAPVRIAHRRSGKLLGIGIIQGGDEHADEVAAPVVRAAKFVGPHATCSAEVFERRLGLLAVADRVVAAAQEVERLWLYECLPRARLRAEGAIAFASPLSEIDI